MNLRTIPEKIITFIVIIFISTPLLSNNCTKLMRDENSEPSNNGLAVYLDMGRRVDEDYIRQEIPVVDYVRDRELADVHIMITSHSSGRAGRNYVISIIGERQFEGMNNDLFYWASSTESRHETREGYTQKIKIGLAPYLSNIEGMQEIINLEYKVDIDPDEDIDPEEAEDPWKRWIFEVYGGGNFSWEETRSSISFRYGFYADKVTKDWKIRARPYFNYSEDEYLINDTTVTRISHRDGFDGYLIKSLTDHWSAGVFTDMLSSTYHNMDFQIEAAPAIEFSLFPYEEATRRSITFAYGVGGSYNDYIEETIFEKTEETLWGHRLEMSANYRQTWGRVRAGVTGFQHFHDLRSNRLEMYTRINLLLFEGFSLSVRGNFDLINDLVAIPREELSEHEILLEQRRRATDYQFSGSINLSYTFGSDLAGEYNPRL